MGGLRKAGVRRVGVRRGVRRVGGPTQKKWGPEGWGAEGWGARRVGGPKGGGARRVGGPKGGAEAAGARTRQPENSKRAHLRVPAFKIPREDPQRGKKNEFCGGTGKKKSEILGGPREGRQAILFKPLLLTRTGRCFNRFDFLSTFASPLVRV